MTSRKRETLNAFQSDRLGGDNITNRIESNSFSNAGEYSNNYFVY